jgi:hypothetical protein
MIYSDQSSQQIDAESNSDGDILITDTLIKIAGHDLNTRTVQHTQNLILQLEILKYAEYIGHFS